MAQANVYLIFNGNCREAMHFYKEALGGELNITTMGDSPMKDQVPPEIHPQVMHAMLQNDSIVLLASDGAMGQPVTLGNAITLALQATSVEEAEHFFTALSKGGTTTMPMQETYWALRYGQLTDRFGVQWLINLSK
ncbi:VOC family protein [Chitinophaga nivalis]|uniref:VOC family protein n=1 Tax=Chitinophaga nivalis TaxID=2991709 RepID=A0ABT3IWT9_9BACT|nr:VOC family protein [Chitinophaga nivalis]MCW3461863.1 VOC family protein [Chitinophaga nivalis]MCW3488446.1 VOC family protein [Chitinophaga nivalis]